MSNQNNRNEFRKSKHRRLLFKIKGTEDKPRLSVYKSNKNTYLQLIDDRSNKVLLAVNTLQKDIVGQFEEEEKAGTKAGDRKLGEIAAKKISELGIKEIVFDRSGYKYHGRIKEIADGARSTKLIKF